MKIEISPKLNERLYLKNPQESELGKMILGRGINQIYQYGFESLTFKKLAVAIGTTEAGVYRYFENKHRLLLFLISWYWSYIEFQIISKTENIANSSEALNIILKLLVFDPDGAGAPDYIDTFKLHQIVISESSKAYLTHNVLADNRQQLFRPYKDLCATIGGHISRAYPQYPYPRSLASTLVETSHFQAFFVHNLPSLTDFPQSSSLQQQHIYQFLTHLLKGACQFSNAI